MRRESFAHEEVDRLWSISYKCVVYTVVTLPEFDAWLHGIKDRRTRHRLTHRLDKAQLGNLGDVKQVGSGVWEMREHFGPGWRMYYMRKGSVIVVMLGGGDKSTQERDIAKAVLLAKTSELEG